MSLDTSARVLELLGGPAPLGLDHPVHFIKSRQREGVSIQILEPREYSAPNGLLFRRHCRLRQTVVPHAPLVVDSSKTRCGTEPDATLAPFFKLGDHIFGNEHDTSRAADQFVLRRVRRRR